MPGSRPPARPCSGVCGRGAGKGVLEWQHLHDCKNLVLESPFYKYYNFKSKLDIII